jgi:tetratricopeptide (TPR) repeat protein
MEAIHYMESLVSMPGVSRLTLIVFALVTLCASRCSPVSLAAELTDAYELFRTGKYEDCSQHCHEAIEAGEFSESWRILKIQAELADGQHVAARTTLDKALERFTSSVRLRWIGTTVCRMVGDETRAAKLLAEIDELVSRSAWQYSDPPSRVTLGRFYLSRGIDAKQVLEATFSYIKKNQPDYAEAFLAAGQLALDKHDYALAAEELQKALKLDATDPDIRFGLAQAYEPSDSEKAEEHLKAALARNPNHIDSLLFMVDSHIDAERYDDAREVLQQVFAINPVEPRAWAFRAALAHLEGDLRSELAARNIALAWWPRNPTVDYLIGRELAQKYRFREGSAYQRRSLAFDPQFQPARIQLSQDLLRLGEEDEGWQLADQVFTQDSYQIVAHNLTTLRDHLKGFRTLTTDGFIVRMDQREADIYGDQVLELLQRARKTLCEKYEVKLDRPVLVEVFPEQQDFAIRTFGLPGGAGFLGVCFGNVITANSPASQGENPSNWQSVLWHEFCHVVTLNKTRNVMPRWLSEGISVYEERQANSTWGQWLTPRYREMILGTELTPVSQLSGAFLNPKSPAHLQFAYYESSLVVEFLVERYGFETLRRVLTDLGAGMPVNESLGRYAGSIEALDSEFADYAKKFAERLGPDVDWSPAELDPKTDATEVAAWLKEHSTNYEALKQLVQLLIANEQWAAAKEPLERLVKLLPDDRSSDNAYSMLVVLYRRLGDTTKEKEALLQLTKIASDAIPAYLRLAELSASESQWPDAQRYADLAAAVNPLLPAVQRQLAKAAEQNGNDAVAIRALRATLALSPFDKVDAHYRLACLLQRAGDLPSAKRHVLMALEEAPRFRDGHRKLLEIAKSLETKPSAAAPEPTP